MEKCGVLFWPQLLLSILVLTLIAGYLFAWIRKESIFGQRPWTDSLDPLANLAVAIGLFGSVIGFISAFSGFQKGVDVSALAHGLSIAYWTTGVGLATSLIAMLGCYLLNLLSKRTDRRNS
jgi:biopolymer transport protein ExbB/TolQ